MLAKKPSTTWAAQSCITAISFPKTIAELEGMIEKNSGFGAFKTDMDMLLTAKPEDALYWTASRWMTEGDILFFYHTLSARSRIAALRKQLSSSVSKQPIDSSILQRLESLFGLANHGGAGATLDHVLEQAARYAERYAGTIFACAQVIGSSTYLHKPEDEDSHFRSTVFAPLDEVHIFDKPLQAAEFEECISISRRSTLTSLAGKSFTCIKDLFARHNRLPAFLLAAEPGGKSFRDVHADTWRTISCDPAARFIDEAQIRAYLLDYLLDEIKDRRTLLLEECRCFRNETATGFADYMISLFGMWVPVEAKLNLLSERDLHAQLDKYTHITNFAPTKGSSRHKQYSTDDMSICLVVDQSGLYATSERSFIDCEPGRPLIRREELADLSGEAIRYRLQALFSKS